VPVATRSAKQLTAAGEALRGLAISELTDTLLPLTGLYNRAQGERRNQCNDTENSLTYASGLDNAALHTESIVIRQTIVGS
jgi:hypothetical protein